MGLRLSKWGGLKDACLFSPLSEQGLARPGDYAEKGIGLSNGSNETKNNPITFDESFILVDKGS